MNATRPAAKLAKSLLVSKNGLYNAVRLSSAYKPPAFWSTPTLSELPTPQGSWQADYEANQRKYTRHLIGGIAFYVFTLVVSYQSGLIPLYASPPPLPEEDSK